MAKLKIQYSCDSCGYISLKWLGCCPECKEWDSFSEIKPKVSGSLKEMIANAPSGRSLSMHALSSISSEQKPRMKSGLDEWDRVLGDGIMPGSLLVLTGDPGIGKSTLLLQVCNLLAYQHRVFIFLLKNHCIK
jgi:Predicted ATP-dependent serine protease